MSKVWELIYESPDVRVAADRISEELDSLSRTTAELLAPEYGGLLDDIVADLRSCMYSRAAQGTDNAFFERIFSIYRCGSWPCGWDGNYPDGRLAVYIPNVSYDHYDAARTIADNLRKEGMADWAAKVTDAIEGGSPGNGDNDGVGVAVAGA